MNNGIKIKENLKPYIVFSVLAFALYGNTLNHSFVLDDAVVITNNSYTQQGIKGIPAILKYDTFNGYLVKMYESMDLDADPFDNNIVAGGRYRPLSLITYALEIEFFSKDNSYFIGSKSEFRFRGNAFFSHLFNIFMYLYTSCLFFAILHRLFPPEPNKNWYLSFPFLATVLFLAHPIHTEVVANIKGRDEIMALMGSLSALWFAIKYVDSRKYKNLVWSGLCLFLGLLSKENTITFVGVIPVTLYYFANCSKKRIFISLIPLVITSALFLIIRASVSGPINTSEIGDLLNNPFVYATQSETFATTFYTLLLYVKLLIFPHPLTWDYYPFHIELVNWSNSVASISLLFYLCIGLYAVYGLVKKRDIWSWSIWLYLMPLSVVSNLFFPIGAFMGERFVFFSSVGFAVLTGWLIAICIPRLVRDRWLYLPVVVTGLLLCLYSIKTIDRNRAWKDAFSLFITDVKTSPNSAKGNYEAGSTYMSKTLTMSNREDILMCCYEADRYFKKALLLYPHYLDAMIRIGDLHATYSGNIAESLQYYARALQYETVFSSKIDKITREILNMTNILLDEKLIISTPEEMLKSCNLLLSVRPDIGEAYFVKGVIYGKYLHNVEAALANLEYALSIDFTKTVRFYEYLGAAYGMSGNYPDALQYLLKAVEMESDDIDTYLNLGIIYRKLGDIDNSLLFTEKGNKLANGEKVETGEIGEEKN